MQLQNIKINLCLISLNFNRGILIECSYMKDGLQASNKMNSLARSNASLYGNKDDLYDRLRRHAYQGKKSGKINLGIFKFDESFSATVFQID